MPDRIERQPPGPFCGIVAQRIGDQSVAQLMEGDADKRRDDAEQHTQDRREIKALPYFLQRAYAYHPFYSILSKCTAKYKT